MEEAGVEDPLFIEFRVEEDLLWLGGAALDSVLLEPLLEASVFSNLELVFLRRNSLKKGIVQPRWDCREGLCATKRKVATAQEDPVGHENLASIEERTMSLCCQARNIG